MVGESSIQKKADLMMYQICFSSNIKKPSLKKGTVCIIIAKYAFITL